MPLCSKVKPRDLATLANCHQCLVAGRHAACTWSRRCRARPNVETLQPCKRTACPGSGKRVRKLTEHRDCCSRQCNLKDLSEYLSNLTQPSAKGTLRTTVSHRVTCPRNSGGGGRRVGARSRSPRSHMSGQSGRGRPRSPGSAARHTSSQHTGAPAPPPPAAHLAAAFQVWVVASHATILRSCDLLTVCCTPKAS